MIKNHKLNFFHRKNGAGFTLIELLVVIAVIGLLASIVMVSLNAARTKARDAKRIADLKQISTALELFYDTYGRYPVTAGSPTWEGHWINFKNCLQAGVGCGFTISGTYQPAIQKVPDDPLNKTPDVDDNSITYYPPYAGNDQGYALMAILETDHPALQGDADGAFYSGWLNGCEDTNRYYCIKKSWPY